jgi:hypothetical protein
LLLWRGTQRESGEFQPRDRLEAYPTLLPGAFGDRAFYNGDWLLRAASALAGIYGNIAAEAMYPLAVKDIEGRKLDGSKYS